MRSRPDSLRRIAVLREHPGKGVRTGDGPGRHRGPEEPAEQPVGVLGERWPRRPDRGVVGGWVPERVPVTVAAADDVDVDADAAYVDAEAADAEEAAAAARAGGADDTVRPARRGGRRLSQPFGRFAELWVPESLRDARVDPGRRGVVVLLLVAALAAVATAVGVWRDRPEPRPVETSALAALAVPSASPAPSSAAPPGGGQPGTSGSAAEIVVSVTGLVTTPGVVTLPAGSRVADAIAAAGGATADADLTGLNLAARMADGDAVVVGGASDPGGSPSGVSGGAGPAGGLIDLNSADEAALDTLPGVGPVMAQNILAWRETNGRFSTVEQLQEISGIGPSRFAQIAPLVTVS